MFFQDKKIIDKFGSILFNFNMILAGILKEQNEPKINLNQFRTLNILRLKNDIIASELADLLNITPASMTINIEHLVQHNLVRQIDSKDDRRQKNLKITLKGILKVASIGKQIAGKVSPAKNILTEEERKSLLELLTKIDDALK